VKQPELDPSGADVERSRQAKVVHAARIPVQYSEALEAEATRRGITPSALICEFVIAGLRGLGDDTVVSVRASDLHRAIDQAIRAA